jgi:hypothetical protein
MASKRPLVNSAGVPKELATPDDLLIPAAVLLTDIADPALPAAGTTKFYSKNIAGASIVRYMGSDGIDHHLQSILALNMFGTIRPSGGASAPFIEGAAFGTNVGTWSHPAPTSTNLGTSVPRSVLTSAATAPSFSSTLLSVARVWRGNAAGLGGFFYVQRIKLDTMQAGQRGFFGLNDDLAAATNIDPTTTTAQNKVGLAFALNTGNWKLINNAAASAPTVLDLGASFPLNTTDMIELILYCPPNGSTVGYRVQNMSSGVISSGTLSTNLPANTAFLAPKMWMTNNATAASVAFSIYSATWEADN